MKFIRTFTVVLSFFVACNVLATNLFESKERTFLTGLLVDINGKTFLMAGNALTPHSEVRDYAVKAAGASYRDENTKIKILWAGELEVIDGKVTRANETAGIIDKEKDLIIFKENPGLARKNLLAFLEKNPLMKKTFFLNTVFNKYDVNSKHLEPELKYLSNIRHDVRNFCAIRTVDLMNTIATGFNTINVLYERAEKVEKFLAEMTSLKPLIKEFNEPEWLDVEKGHRTSIELLKAADKLTIEQAKTIDLVLEKTQDFILSKMSFSELNEENVAAMLRGEKNSLDEKKELTKKDIEAAKLILLEGISDADPEKSSKVSLVFRYFEMLDEINAPVKEVKFVIEFLVGVNDLPDMMSSKLVDVLLTKKKYSEKAIAMEFNEAEFNRTAKAITGLPVEMLAGLDTKDIATISMEALVSNLNKQSTLSTEVMLKTAQFMSGENGMLHYLKNRLKGIADPELRRANMLALGTLLEVTEALPYDIKERIDVVEKLDAFGLELKVLVEKEKEKDPEFKKMFESFKTKDGKIDTKRAFEEMHTRGF